jgi:CheY-like chemotaxis protein
MSKSIWVIDDDFVNLMIAKMVIKRNGGFDTVTSYDEAQDAINHIANHLADHNELPDIILLDLNMPVMDGWQFLEEFEILRQSLSKHIDIFILSSSVDVRDIQRSLLLPSVTGFFSKPFTSEMLSAMTASLTSAG